MTSKFPTNVHEKYHAHVYFDETTLSFATELCNNAGKLFNVDVGRIHEKPIGPHPKWSCQLSFTSNEFEQLIPWLNIHRKNLTVFVHGITGDDYKDHTDYAYWLGDAVKLNILMFEKS